MVIGAGVAGLTAATRLAQSGARVCVLAKGVGSTHLAPGLVDVLGYDPERVTSPAEALPSFVEAHPEHPYAVIGPTGSPRRSSGSAAVVDAGPHPSYRYVGDLSAQPRAADGARRDAPVRARPGDVRPGRARRQARRLSGRSAWSGSACCATSTRRCAPRNLERDGRRGQSRAGRGRRRARAEANALGLARRMRRRRFRATFAAQLLPLLHAGERVGAAGHPRASRPARSLVGARAPARARGVRDPDAAALGIRDPRLRRAARGTARRRRAARDRRRGRSSVERDGDRVTAVRAHTSGHDHVYARALGGAGDRRLHVGRDRARIRLARSRHGPRAGAARACPATASRDSAATTSANSRWRGSASRSTPRCWPTGPPNVLVAGAALPGAEPWREGSGEGIALSSGLSPRGRCSSEKERRLPHERGEPDHRGAGHELLRSSLDHCVKCTICETVVPGLERHPAVPRPEVRRAAGRALPGRGHAVARVLGRLLLGMRAVHDALSPGRSDRRAQRPRPPRGQGAGRRQVPRPRDRPADRGRAPGHARLRRWPTRRLRFGPARVLVERVLGIHRKAALPKFAGRDFPALGEASPGAGERQEDPLLPRLRHRVLRARRRREGRRRARAQRLPGGGPKAGLLRAPAAVQRPVRRRAQVRPEAGAHSSRRSRATAR